MPQVLFNRRTGRPVTVSDKLARALAKGGRYLRRDMQAEAAEPMLVAGDQTGEDVVEDAQQTPEQSAPADQVGSLEQAERATEAPPAAEAASAQAPEAAAPAQPAAAEPNSMKRARRNQRAG